MLRPHLCGVVGLELAGVPLLQGARVSELGLHVAVSGQQPPVPPRPAGLASHSVPHHLHRRAQAAQVPGQRLPHLAQSTVSTG